MVGLVISNAVHCFLNMFVQELMYLVFVTQCLETYLTFEYLRVQK